MDYRAIAFLVLQVLIISVVVSADENKTTTTPKIDENATILETTTILNNETLDRGNETASNSSTLEKTLKVVVDETTTVLKVVRNEIHSLACKVGGIMCETPSTNLTEPESTPNTTLKSIHLPVKAEDATTTSSTTTASSSTNGTTKATV